jgi:hypothetical protein
MKVLQRVAIILAPLQLSQVYLGLLKSESEFPDFDLRTSQVMKRLAPDLYPVAIQ